MRFVFSNTKPIDIRFFLDDNGEIHSSLRIVPESRQKIKKQENMLISKKETREDNEKY